MLLARDKALCQFLTYTLEYTQSQVVAPPKQEADGGADNLYERPRQLHLVDAYPWNPSLDCLRHERICGGLWQIDGPGGDAGPFVPALALF